MKYKIVHHRGWKSDLFVGDKKQLEGRPWDEISQYLLSHVNPFDTVIEGFDRSQDKNEDHSIKYTGFRSLCSIRWGNKLEVWAEKDLLVYIWLPVIQLLRLLNVIGTAVWWVRRSLNLV